MFSSCFIKWHNGKYLRKYSPCSLPSRASEFVAVTNLAESVSCPEKELNKN